MKLFLSYASENADIAESIHLALIGSGYQVFMDKSGLNPSDNYDVKLRAELNNADGLVFLISPHSVKPGGYALTELKYARQKWPHPQHRVLPVMVQKTDYDAIPAYLKAVTILEPEGNLAAEVTDSANKAFLSRLDDSKITADAEPDPWQKYRSLATVVFEAVVIATVLSTWFKFTYPNVPINFNLASLFVVVGLLMVLVFGRLWAIIRKMRKQR